MLQRDPFNPFPHTPGEVPSAHRKGYFEITYAPGKPGTPDRGLTVHCLVAGGFLSAKEAFDAMGIGTFRSIREISEEVFQAWAEPAVGGKWGNNA